MRDEESQLQAHHVSQTNKHGGGAIFGLGCEMCYKSKIKGKMTQVLNLSILEDGVMKIIEWYCFKPSRVIFQHDNDPKHIAKF